MADPANLAEAFADLLARSKSKNATRLEKPTPQWVDALESYYRDGALLFESEEHDAWVVAITEAAPMLFVLARQALEEKP